MAKAKEQIKHITKRTRRRSKPVGLRHRKKLGPRSCLRVR